jgi:hypothetical protein
MIEFSCICGKKIRVAYEHAGKRGRCPSCKTIVTVPKPVTASIQETPDFFQQMLSQSYEQQATNTAAAAREPASTAEMPISAHVATAAISNSKNSDIDKDKQRHFPAVIDVFLYSFSLGGIMQVVIYAFVPTILSILFGLIPGINILVAIMNILIALYTYWYVCECVRDSAGGNVRAPDIVTCMPDLSEAFWEVVRVLVCTLLFGLAPIAYFAILKRTDAGFWTLLALSCTVYPMALLAVIMFDSVSGLNPILVIGSIFSTFFQYIPVVLLVWLVMIIRVIIQYYLEQTFLLEFLGKVVFVYASMLAAHILGRFFYRNSERLRWEV